MRIQKKGQKCCVAISSSASLRISRFVHVTLCVFLSMIPRSLAQQCPLTIWVYEIQSQCDGGQTPSAIGGLYADETCRMTQIMDPGTGNSSSLLPGRYSARCVSVNQVEIYQSGCLTADCSSSTGGICNRDVTAVASFYSRLSPPRYLVQNYNTQFQTCLVLTGSDKSVTFSIFGNCNDPVCYNDVFTGNATSTATTSSATRFPTETPIVPSPSTESPTLSPSEESATAKPTNKITFDTIAPTSQPPTPLPSLRAGTTATPSRRDDVDPGKKDETAPTLSPSPVSNIPLKPPLEPSPSSQNLPTRAPAEGGTGGGDVATPISASGSTGSTSTSANSSHLAVILGSAFGGLFVFILLLVIGYMLGSKRGTNKHILTANTSGVAGGAGAGGHIMEQHKLVSNGIGNHPTPRTLPNSEIYCYGEDDISTLGPPMGLSFVDETTAASIVDYDYAKVSILQQQQQAATATVADQTTASSQKFSTAVSLQAGSYMADEASFEEQFHTGQENHIDGFDDDEDDRDAAGALGIRQHPRSLQFEVTVPPGKLGMVIDDPKGFPEVIAIKADSVLMSQGVEKGDRLLSVDDLDVSHMSCLETSNLISRKSDRRRKLLFLRQQLPNNGSRRNIYEHGSSSGGVGGTGNNNNSHENLGMMYSA